MNILSNFLKVYIANRCHCLVIDMLSDRGWGEETLENNTVTFTYHVSNVSQCQCNNVYYCQIVSAFKTEPQCPALLGLDFKISRLRPILGLRSCKYLVMIHVMTPIIMLTSWSSLDTSSTVGQQPEPSQHVWAHLWKLFRIHQSKIWNNFAKSNKL